ncbi:hypothetical protein D3C75_811040 [compost metagenome]
MREDTLLHPDNEDGRELQPLGAVHGHQHHSIAAFLLVIHAVDVCDQRQISQEGYQRLILIVLFKFHGYRQEFVDIFQTGAGFQGILILQLQPVLGQLQDLLRQLRHGQEFHHPVQRLDHIVELYERISRPPCKTQIIHRLQCPEDRHAL